MTTIKKIDVPAAKKGEVGWVHFLVARLTQTWQLSRSSRLGVLVFVCSWLPGFVGTQTVRRNLFVDEQKTKYFRRLAFSPDGRLLVCPAGMLYDVTEPAPGADDKDAVKEDICTTYVFSSKAPST